MGAITAKNYDVSGWPRRKKEKGLSSAQSRNDFISFRYSTGREENFMKYLFAWGLGVPGVLIVAWFLMSHH
jgi:hypothetical protein